MFDKSDLKAAEEAGILTRDQASRLTAFLEARRDPARPTGDPESLKFLSNFNDIFVTIGLLILVAGAYAVFALTFGLVNALLVPVSMAGVCWLLAEYFARRRRMLLPSMLLSLLFTLNAGLATGLLLSGVTGVRPDALSGLFGAIGKLDDAGVGTFVGGLIAAGLVWWRFRLPFSLFLMAMSAAGMIYSLIGFHGDANLIIGGMLSLLIGTLTLAAAVWFDSKDPDRITRKADYGFWLHVAAAPQIVLGVRGLITGNPFGTPAGVEAFFMLAALTGLAILSLALNRRALILSGLFAFWLALNNIVGETGTSNSFIVSAFLLGTGIVLLGGGWHSARKLALKFLPRGGALDRIFPPERT